MKILYIASLAFKKASSASIRNISLINGLIENGHNVDLLTIKYPENSEDFYLKNILSKKVNIFFTEIPIINKYLNNKTNTGEKKSHKTYSIKRTLIKIAKNYYYFPDIDKYWINNYNKTVLDRDYDIIISSSDTKTSHFVAYEVNKKMSSKKWYQIWGDPWNDDINIHKLNKRRIRIKEEHLIKMANKVFYVSLPTATSMKEKYPLYSDKINYLGRSYLSKSYGRIIGSTDTWILTYTGSVNNNRNIIELIRKINEFNSISDKKIKLDIYGKCDDKTFNEIIKFSCVDIKGIVDYKHIIEAYKSSDLLVFIDNGETTTQIPGKLYDYFGTDRPIIALVDNTNSPVAKFLSSTNRCIVNKNNYSKIDLNFVNYLSEQKVLAEYSGENIAEKIFV